MATLSQIAKNQNRLGMTEGPLAATNLTPDQYARGAGMMQEALGIAPATAGSPQLSAVAGARRSAATEPKVTLYGTLGQRLKAIDSVKQSISNHYAQYDAAKRLLAKAQRTAAAEQARMEEARTAEQRRQQETRTAEQIQQQQAALQESEAQKARRSRSLAEQQQATQAVAAARMAENKKQMEAQLARQKAAQEAAQAKAKAEQDEQNAAFKKQQDDYEAFIKAGEKNYQEAEKKPKREFIEKLIKTRQDNYMRAMARKDPNSMLVYNPGLAHITNGGDGYTVEIPEFPKILAPDDPNYKAPGVLPALEDYLAPYEDNFKAEPALTRVYWQLKPEQREGYMRAYEAELNPTPEGMGTSRATYLESIGFKLDPNKPLIKEPTPGWKGPDPAYKPPATPADPRNQKLPAGSDQPAPAQTADTYKRSYDLAAQRYLLDNPDVYRSGMDPWEHYVKYGASQGKVWPGETKPGATAPIPREIAKEPQAPPDIAPAPGSKDDVTPPAQSAAGPEDPNNSTEPKAVRPPEPPQPGYQLFGGSPETPEEPPPVIKTPKPASQNLTYPQAAARYLQDNPDVARAGMDPWEHYQRWGKNEGRVWRGEAQPAINYGGFFGGSPEM